LKEYLVDILNLNTLNYEILATKTTPVLQNVN